MQVLLSAVHTERGVAADVALSSSAAVNEVCGAEVDQVLDLISMQRAQNSTISGLACDPHTLSVLITHRHGSVTRSSNFLPLICRLQVELPLRFRSIVGVS